MSKISTENSHRDVWMLQTLLFVDFIFSTFVGYKKKKHRMVTAWEIVRLALIIQLTVGLA